MFGEVGSVTVGGTPSTSVPEYWGGDFPWMASGDAHGRVIDDVPTRISGLGLRHSSAKMVDAPSVAVALAGQGRTRGTAAYVRCALCTNQSVALLKGNPGELDTEYLLHNLSFRYSELRARSAGGGRAGLTKTILEQLPLPLPAAVPEQSKIAEVLSTVDRAIEQTEALIVKLQRIKAGLMQDLLTRGIDEHGNLRSEQTHKFKDSPLGRIPIEWACDRLGLHLTTIEQGWSPDCDGDPAPVDCWGVLKTTAVVWDGYQDFENKLLPSGLGPRPRLEVQPTDVLMTRGGPNSRVGVVAYVRTTQQKLMLSDKLYRLRYKLSVHPEFLAMALASSWTQRHLSTLKTGLAESQTNISQAIVKNLLIRVPLPGEQEQIASVVSELDRQLMQLRFCLEKLRAVKTGLMQDLLTGHRRVTALLKSSKELVDT